jgi:hypothetical protein
MKQLFKNMQCQVENGELSKGLQITFALAAMHAKEMIEVGYFEELYLTVLENTGCLLLVNDICQSHSVCAEDSSILVYIDGVHAQRPGNSAGMLTPSPTKTGHNMVTGI